MAKPLNSRWVIIQKRSAIPPLIISISILKRGGDIIKLLAKKNTSPTSRLSIRKAATTLDKVAIDIILKDREIARLREELAQGNPRKRRKVQPELNERFASLAQVLAQANREPNQRHRQTAKKVVVDKN